MTCDSKLVPQSDSSDSSTPTVAPLPLQAARLGVSLFDFGLGGPRETWSDNPGR